MAPLSMGKPNQDVFAATVLELARQDRDILVVTSDSRGSGKLVPFGQALPQQVVETGIAEQNLVGIASGLAAAGKKVFAVSPACFLTARGVEQIKNDVAYSDRPVKLVGISAGVSYGALGTTHHSLHDFAVLLAFNNLDIVVPADNFETRQAVLAAVHHPRPLYLRFGKQALPDLPRPDEHFEIGTATWLERGEDIAFIATGEPTWRALEASRLLRQQGLSCSVLSMHTLRPLDRAAVMEAARRARVLVTVEEHSVNGGLGSLCAALLMQQRIYRPLHIAGIPDEYTMTGSQDEIMAHYGLTPEGLAASALALLDPIEQGAKI